MLLKGGEIQFFLGLNVIADFMPKSGLLSGADFVYL
jgi:hypothetical protein